MTERQAIEFVFKVRSWNPRAKKADLELLDELSFWLQLILVTPALIIFSFAPGGAIGWFGLVVLLGASLSCVYCLLLISKANAAKKILIQKGKMNFD